MSVIKKDLYSVWPHQALGCSKGRLVYTTAREVNLCAHTMVRQYWQFSLKIFSLHLSLWHWLVTAHSGSGSSPLTLVLVRHLSLWYWLYTSDSDIHSPPLTLVLALHLSLWYCLSTSYSGIGSPLLTLVLALHISLWYWLSTSQSGIGSPPHTLVSNIVAFFPPAALVDINFGSFFKCYE